MPSLQENIQRVAEYYASQAPEYDEVSGIGTQHFETTFAQLKTLYRSKFSDHDVLELACGTGYWTEVLADTARSVLATDVNPELVELSKNKLGRLSNVKCQVADAYSLENISGTFTAAFSHFWWSHVPKKRLRSFLETLHARLEPGALVLFADLLEYNLDWVKRRIDEHGDTYEERVLRDGRRFETIKNFPSESEITESLRGIADKISYSTHLNENVWTVFYRVRSQRD